MLDPKVLAKVLDAVADLNAEFLEALVETARSAPDQFPLSHCLRSEFRRLMVKQCRERGRCGVFLVDAAFSDHIRWARIASRDLDAFPQDPAHWLSIGQGMVVAHSALIVAWHIVHAVPSLVSVLLGMSDEVMCEFGRLSISDLTYIARTRFSWVRPRWADRADVWASIIASGHCGSDQEPAAILRCLKVSASESRRMLNSTAPGITQEL